MTRRTTVDHIAALFEPIGLDQFRSQILEREVFRSPSGISPALGLWDLDRHGDALWSHRDRISEFLYFTNRAQGVDPPRSAQNDLLRFAVTEFSRGTTLVARRLGDLDPDLARLQRASEAALGCRVSINAYLTPPGGEGFLDHFDTHDTLILQVHGTKRWRLRNGGPTLPHRRQAVELDPDDLGPITEEFDLHCGGVLYLPRGVVHAARSTDDISLHLTLGLHPVLWSDVALEAVGLSAEIDSTLRSRAEGEVPRSLLDRFGPELVARARERLAVADIDERSKKSIMILRDAFRRPFEEPTIVRRDPLLPAAVVSDGSSVSIRFPGSLEVGINAPVSCEPALRFIASTSDTFTVHDLPALSERSAAVLIRRLHEVGLLVEADR